MLDRSSGSTTAETFTKRGEAEEPGELPAIASVHRTGHVKRPG